jgi:hypothetical protein
MLSEVHGSVTIAQTPFDDHGAVRLATSLAKTRQTAPSLRIADPKDPFNVTRFHSAII